MKCLYRFIRMSLVFFIFAFPALAFSPSDIAKDYQYLSVEISPNGTYLAVTAVVEGKRRLMILEADTLKVISTSGFPNREEIGEVYWVNNERMVIEVMHRKGWKEELEFYGELYAVNYDGSKSRMIYGYRAGESSLGFKGRRRSEATYGWAEIIDYLPHDEEHILISSTPMSSAKDRLAMVAKLNVYTGVIRNKVTRSPISYADFLTDGESNLRMAIGLDDEYIRHVYTYDAVERDWTELPKQQYGRSFSALGFNAAGDKVYVLDDLNADMTGLYQMDLTTGKRSLIYSEKNVDITSAVYAADNNSVYALRVDDGYPAYVLLDKSTEEAKTFKRLIASMPGYNVQITSQTRDASKAIVYVSSDTSPGAFYLFDKEANKLKILVRNLSHIDQSLYSSSEPIKFTNRDGVEIHGYLTRPKKAKADERVPLVVLVHGGPHYVRDDWSFDRDVQLLSSLGYAVLRVNYQGSGGYGRTHFKAGLRHWGDVIQHDIIDATRWAIKNKAVDSDRVCIMGASFGGYSAVMSSLIEPDLYRCAVATSGIYDLEYMYEDDSLLELTWGEDYLEMAIGNDVQELKRFSPVYQVEKLKARLLIAHGERDKKAPIEQAEKLAEALKKANKSYKWFIKEKEGHGFFNEQNREEYYEEVARFLGESLK